MLWDNDGGAFAASGLATRAPGDARGDGSDRVYWKPVWRVLEGQFEWLLANATQVKALRGRKSDLKDGERIADFLQHGLLQGRFVPPRPIQQLRDLTRSRTLLKQEQARISNRILKVLEDANIKPSSVMTDVMGVSGRARLRARMEDYFDRLDQERFTKLLVKRLERLGHKVSLQPAA